MPVTAAKPDVDKPIRRFTDITKQIYLRTRVWGLSGEVCGRYW